MKRRINFYFFSNQKLSSESKVSVDLDRLQSDDIIRMFTPFLKNHMTTNMECFIKWRKGGQMVRFSDLKRKDFEKC